MTAAQRIDVTVEVNGRAIAAQIEPRMLLVDFLRSHAHTTSLRIGCEEGACGACTAELDGKIVKSCLVLAARADGRSVTTVEGIGEGRELTALQKAFVSCHALQCGYCTAGMLMSARAFLTERGDQDFTDDEVRQALTGNYCRCTGYGNIIHAVRVAAGRAGPLAQPESLHRAGENWIGKPVARREDRRLVTGRGRYVDNFAEPSDLHAAAARASRAHALIKHVDVTRAKDMPGVRWVMTGAQARAHWNPISPTMDLLELKLPQRYALAVDKVVYYGEPVALVVADTPYQAEDAARAVVIDYEDLPVNVDPEAAADVAPGNDALLYSDWQSNVQVEFAFEHGDVDAVFADADLVVDENVVSHRFGAMPMETRVVRASFDPGDERLVIRSSTQVPHQMRMYINRVFGIPETRIQVLSDDVGGGFGSKLSVDSEYLPVLASIMLGRPVNWFESRSEWFHAGPVALESGATALSSRWKPTSLPTWAATAPSAPPVSACR
jgi:aerobic-type carbon monoxide dehydrogenase small subunit (CoxS/CutS family)